jgi:hypothetical protein
MAIAHETIDHATLARLVEAGAVRGANVVGQPGGWGVVVQYGMTQRALAAKRGAVRLFRHFETLANYLRDIGIVRYHVDASHFDAAAGAAERRRDDAAERMKAAHEAAAYNAWLKAKVDASLAGIEDGTNPIIPDEEWEAERAQWLREAA